MKQEIKTVLVTGGAGYIGSALVSLLLGNDYHVTVIDNLVYGTEPLLNALRHPSFTFIRGDITSLESLQTAFENHSFDAVIHLAAIVGDPACAKQPGLARAVNWDGSLNVLDYSIKNNVKRFIYASTCSNYGKMLDPNGYVDEASPLAPISLYAELKVKFEHVLLNESKKKNDFCPVSLRFATAYGVSPRMRFDLTVNEFTKELTLGRELKVFGEQFWRPYCHVDDIARAIALILKSDKEKTAYNVFNVGDTHENYQKQMIVEEIKKLIPVVRVKYIQKNEDPRDYRVSFKKINDELGFSICKKVPDGIREIIHLIKNKIIQNPDHSIYRNS